MTLKSVLFEFFGTVVFIVAGCTTAVSLQASYLNPAAFLLTALVFGGVYAVLYAAFHDVSGCHLNPAITISQLVEGNIKPLQALGYIVAQLLGAGLSAVIVWYMSTDPDYLIQYGCNSFYDGDFIKTVIAEAVAGFTLAAAYAAAYRNKNKIIGGMINGTIYTALFSMTLPLDRGGVNVLKSLAMFLSGVLAGRETTPQIQPVIAILIGSVLGVLLACIFIPRKTKASSIVADTSEESSKPSKKDKKEKPAKKTKQKATIETEEDEPVIEQPKKKKKVKKVVEEPLEEDRTINYRQEDVETENFASDADAYEELEEEDDFFSGRF